MAGCGEEAADSVAAALAAAAAVAVAVGAVGLSDEDGASTETGEEVDGAEPTEALSFVAFFFASADFFFFRKKDTMVMVKGATTRVQQALTS